MIPFSLTLAGLTLHGKDRERARAHHSLKGEELERELLAIDYDTDVLRDTDEYKIRKLEIDHKYNKINDFDFEITLNNIKEKEDVKRRVKELEIMKKWAKISNVEFMKKKNDLLHKPWVAIKTRYDEDVDPDNMEIEVAYNNTFIEKMRAKGLPGDTPDDVAEQWLKLFLISNLDTDDLAMIEDDESDTEDYPQLSKAKIGDKTFIG